MNLGMDFGMDFAWILRGFCADFSVMAFSRGEWEIFLTAEKPSAKNKNDPKSAPFCPTKIYQNSSQNDLPQAPG